MKVVMYMRVGRAEQIEDTFSHQEQQLRIFADEHGMNVNGVFKDVGSGLTFERPGWKSLLSEISAKPFDAVLAGSLSRIGRDTFATLEAIDNLEQKGVRVVCADGSGMGMDLMRDTRRYAMQQCSKQRKKRNIVLK